MRILLSLCIYLMFAFPCTATTIIVAKDGSGDFATIQAAINASWHGDVIFVNPGTYSESLEFGGRAIKVTSSDPNNSTVVQSTIISKLTFSFGEGSGSILTGFTVRGIVCNGSSPTITRNIISGVSGENSYSAIYCSSANPSISYNTIINNTTCGITGSNGAIYSNTITGNQRGISQCNGIIHDNIISNNSSSLGVGGGLYNCNGTITNNVISGNIAITIMGDVYGGGLYKCNGTITNNLISGNKAITSNGYAFGGGLSNCSGTITNNIISGNSVSGTGGSGHGIGAGIYTSGFNGTVANNTIVGHKGSPIVSCLHVTNNIIAFNDAGGPSTGYSYNNFWNTDNSGSGGTNNFVTDPLFAVNGYWDTNGVWVDGDYHLKSRSGRWDKNTSAWVLDAVTSSCIDAGDPSTLIGTEPNPNGGRINVGNYGGTAEASKSPTGIITPVCTIPPAMDFNGDCKVDFNDFAIFAQSWLECNIDPPSACWQ